jgi:DNA polymerase III psi subunit
LDDVVQTLRGTYRWLRQGCEIGMYPYVIPFSGAAFARDPSLVPHTRYLRRQVAGTNVAWDQPAKILPIDPVVRDVILRMEHNFETVLASLEKRVAHLPSRVRSLLWILSAMPILAEFGHFIADESEIQAELSARLPAFQPECALPVEAEA